MSIIEKAMRKLNGTPEELKHPAAAEQQPGFVRHPTAAPAAGEKQPALRSEVPPRTGTRLVRPTIGTSPLMSQAQEAVAWRNRSAVKLQAEGLLALDYRTQQMAEELRRIKRPLLANAYGKNIIRVERGNLIMLTSALPGEGKSRISLNLAHSMALERDYSVVLVDADITKAQTSRMYGLEREEGLLDAILKGAGGLDEMMRPTDTPGVDVIPAGRDHPQATELLGSSEMERLTLKLGEQDPNRIVILDSPPLLVTNEPQLLARLVGQVVLVVEAGRTPQHVVKEALTMLDHTKAIGLVLNKSDDSFGSDYYGYGYGGYHYSYGRDTRERPENDIGL